MRFPRGFRYAAVAFSVLAAAVLAGCATQPERLPERLIETYPATNCRDFLVGTCHYEMISDSAEDRGAVAHRSSVELNADGTYTLKHTVYPGGPLPSHSEETGRWTAEAGADTRHCVLTFEGVTGSPYAGALEIVGGREIRIGSLRAGRGR